MTWSRLKTIGRCKRHLVNRIRLDWIFITTSISPFFFFLQFISFVFSFIVSLFFSFLVSFFSSLPFFFSFYLFFFFLFFLPSSIFPFSSQFLPLCFSSFFRFSFFFFPFFFSICKTFFLFFPPILCLPFFSSFFSYFRFLFFCLFLSQFSPFLSSLSLVVPSFEYCLNWQCSARSLRIHCDGSIPSTQTSVWEGSGSTCFCFSFRSLIHQF